MSRGRKIRCRGPRARPSSIAMPSRSASGRRSGGSRGRVRLNRACHGNTRTGQDPEENVRNPPNRAVDLEPPVAVRVEDGSPLRMSMLVSDVSRVPPLIALVRCPQGAVRHPNQRLLDRPHVPGREPPVHPERTQVEHSVPFDATGEIDERIDIREDEIPDRAEDGFASWSPGSRDRATVPYLEPRRNSKTTWSRSSCDSMSARMGGYLCCSRIVAAHRAPSRQWTLFARTTPRKVWRVSPRSS